MTKFPKFNPNKASVVVIGIVAIIVLAAIVGGSYLIVKKAIEKRGQAEQPEQPAVEDEFANWKTYRNEEYGFEARHPEDWTANENYLDKEKEILYLTVTDESAPVKMVVCPKVCIDAGVEAYSGTEKEISLDRKQFRRIDLYVREGLERAGMHAVSFLSPKSPLEIGWSESGRIELRTSENNEENDLMILNQILSTFKFLE